ncbi:unnamed protein product [Sphagnum jensenii]|uniref:Endonuclease/exonuclease/phosphatase domain-containing protein n=1 Tax=Sphagnum jensenii TaxID=128206 RepID=A0ABP1B6C6_9BRYO
MGHSQRTSAGTSILVDRRTAPLVVDSEILMEGRAQFIKLQFADSGSLTIVNVFRKMSKNAYTFDNGRSRANSTVSRIDKFMISQDLDSKGERIESTISIRKFSDHSPLLILIWGQPTAPNNLARYFDSSLLGEKENKATMLQAWADDLPTPTRDQEWSSWLEAAIGKVMCCNMRLAKAKNASEAPWSKCTKKNPIGRILVAMRPNQ